MLLNKNVTFSGSDTLVFIILPNTAPIVLGSLTTFSYSSYRAKKPINVLGSILSKGVAKGGRILAGTMVFTILNKHWVNELIGVVPWLREACHRVVYSDELPLFDLLIVSANEYGRHVSMRIQGVNITDEAGVLSVNDAYSENTFSFIAREIATFDNDVVKASDLKYKSNKLFKEFNTASFGGDGWLDKVQNNKLPDNFDKFDDIRNAILDINEVVFDKIVNNLVDLGYEFDDVSNRSNGVVEAIFDVANKFFPNKNVDLDSFLNNSLPYIGKEFFEKNSNFFTSSDENNVYSDKNMEQIINTIGAGEEIVVFNSYVNSYGNTVLYTHNGFLSVDDVYEQTDESCSIDVLLNGAPLLDKTIITNDFLAIVDGLEIVVNIGNTYKEAITNAIVTKDDLRVQNNKREEILAGTIRVNFSDRAQAISQADNKEVLLVVKLLDEDIYTSIKLVKGEI